MPITHVATANGVHAFRDDDPDPVISLQGRPVTGLARADDDLWAVVDHRELWRSSVEGWQHVADVEGVRATCVACVSGQLLIGTSEAHLLRLEDRIPRRVEGFDRVDGHEGWYTPWGGPPDTRSMANWDEDVFVNVHVGGIPRTNDGGATWSPTIDVDADVHHVTTAEGGLVLAACADGLAVSADRGATWAMRTGGLEGTYCRAVAVCGDGVLVSSSLGPRGGRAAVYRGGLAGGPFRRVEVGPGWFDGNIDTYCLDALPKGEPVAAFGTADGRLYLSTDGGSTWTDRASGLPEIRRVLVMP